MAVASVAEQEGTYGSWNHNMWPKWGVAQGGVAQGGVKCVVHYQIFIG